MKSTRKFALLIALFLMTTASGWAQSTRFGHVNSTEIVGMMPDTKKAEDDLKKFTTDLQTQLKAMVDELQSKYQDYQAKASTMADAVKEIRQKEIQDLQQRIDEFQQSAQQNIAKKKEELYSPIFKKVEKAIKEVATEGKYAYVFDTSVGAVLYAQDSDNIIDLVKKKLNLTGLPAAKKEAEDSKQPTGQKNK
jgi:outer membrane protein